MREHEEQEWTHCRFRLLEQVHRQYKALCAEKGITMQEDLESYVMRRLIEAGKIKPQDADRPGRA